MSLNQQEFWQSNPAPLKSYGLTMEDLKQEGIYTDADGQVWHETTNDATIRYRVMKPGPYFMRRICKYNGLFYLD